jgi:hypothetical protein
LKEEIGEKQIRMSKAVAKTMDLEMKRLLTSILFILGLFVQSSCDNNVKRTEMTLKQDDSLNQVVLRTERKNISGLNLLIEGDIKGSGQLKFGDSDSTVYQTYELKEGKIEVKYNGDWYSEFCYVTYKPTSKTKGQLKIEGDFVGD